MPELIHKIQELKKQKNATILAHYYQKEEIQDIADFVGDSLEMAKMARQLTTGTVVICGVSFMAETAQILCPDKNILLPVENAGCSLAQFASPEKIANLRAEYPEAAFVCYVNSSAEVKALCDICCTSANAVKVVRSLPQRQIVMLPDGNLASWVQSQVPEKEIIGFSGHCPSHNRVSAKDVIEMKARHPEALLLAHPEVKKEAWELADFVGSTSAIIKYVEFSKAKEFIIATEVGILHELRQRFPQKAFYLLTPDLICLTMKMINLEDLYKALLNNEHTVKLEENLLKKAYVPLERMFELN